MGLMSCTYAYGPPVGVGVDVAVEDVDGAEGLAELPPPPQPAARSADANATVTKGADKLLLTTCSSISDA
jgi:hypothetical protein